MSEAGSPMHYSGRRAALLVAFAGAFVLLAARAVELQVLNKAFLLDQAEARHLRVVSIPAVRGVISDRNGEPLAMSTPIDSVWANPQELVAAPEHLPALARLLELDAATLRRSVGERAGREFMYLRRHVGPEIAEQVMALGAPGVALQREYRRYYPSGEVAGHLVGFTNIDDVGQEGLELGYDRWLRGIAGAKRVLRDGRGRTVQDVESIREPRPGQDLVLSIDRRVQYLAYRELKAAVLEHRAHGGSAVVLDVWTGEVLAMVNQPAYNPNNRRELASARARNRSATDVFEPGSTIKPFTVAAGLESGLYRPETRIDTAPGQFRVGRNTVKDIRNYGLIDVTTVLSKSSNIGASKIALALPPEQLWGLLNRLGFGAVTGSAFPGEAAGHLAHHARWREIDRATLAYGYGLSVTPLQLVQAYAVLASDGARRPVSFLRVEHPPAGEPVMRPELAARMREMLEAAVGKDGTGSLARVPGYRVAGKTGTVRKSGPGGYAEDRYLAVFAGLAPASRPRLAMVVLIDEPGGAAYYGGQVAAPVFSRVMAGALRLLDIAPDNLPLAQGVRAAVDPT
jgi:cell division protein FtsI (penicillin-binding protein 3)